MVACVARYFVAWLAFRSTILQEIQHIDANRAYSRFFSVKTDVTPYAELSGDRDILFELSSTNPIDFAVGADDRCDLPDVSTGLKTQHNSKGSKFIIDKNSYSTELCLNIRTYEESDVTIKVQEIYSLLKQRTIIKYEDVTKYEYISMFEYIMQD